ncbi:hypothetical protein ACERC8_09515 [Streptococcus sp. E29BA]|uniref:hypothetical protein n=3 Tax=unclassified Streptococcus TaxID=2608887 RepID=UPI00359D6A1A
MIQRMIRLLGQRYERKLVVYVLLLFCLISFSFLQFNLSSSEKNFWLWQLYLTSDLYTAIVGVPLVCLIGSSFISRLFFPSQLALLRFKDKKRLFRHQFLVQVIFGITFVCLLALMGILIGMFTTNVNVAWTPETVKHYTDLFSAQPSLGRSLLSQTILVAINFYCYLFFLLNLHQFCRLLFSDKVSLFLMIAFIFFQSFIYKLTIYSPVLSLLPIYHYQAVHVGAVWENMVYWLSGNLSLIAMTYILAIRRNYTD